jgi:hypothetical protein
MSTPAEIIEQAAWALWRASGSPDGVAKRDPYRTVARALADAGLLADSANAKHECDEVLVNTIRSLGVSIAKREEERDTLAWLHAEAVWQRDEILAALTGGAE